MAIEQQPYLGSLITRPLEPDGPDNLLTSPSINRMYPGGSLAQTIGSLQQLVSADNMGADAWMLISDGSNGPDAQSNRLVALNQMDMGKQPARLFFRTPELRAADVARIVSRTGIREDVVREAVNGLGYGSH